MEKLNHFEEDELNYLTGDHVATPFGYKVFLLKDLIYEGPGLEKDTVNFCFLDEKELRFIECAD